MKELDKNKKIFSSFYIVGCDFSKLQKYIEEDDKKSSSQFIQNIDLLITDFYPNENIFKKKNEKWLKIIKDSNTWFRIKYSKEYDNPITELQMIECNHDEKNILFPKKYYDKGYRPIVINKFIINEKNINNLNPNIIPISKEFTEIENFNEKYVKIPLNLNAKEYLFLQTKKPCVVLSITRAKTFLPFKDIYIKQNLKNNFFQFAFYKHKSPYSYKYMPEILDNYPPDEDSNSSIALFCFPEGIKIYEEYSMPKWFNFVLTDQIGNRTYGTILYFREDLEDEKKNLIDNFIPILKEKNKSHFIEKGICILSNYPFYHNSKLFLKELYRIAFSSGTKIPLERIICNFIDSLYLTSYDKIIRYKVNDLTLDFYQISSYGCDLDTNNDYLELLFRILDFDLIVTAWKCLLLEKTLFLLSTSKATLNKVANALINLLFPFNWTHVFIPILPEKMKLFIESPVPSLIGISFPIKLEEIPNDGLILNIDKNCFENYNNENIIPELPIKLKNKLGKGLLRIKEKYINDYPINKKEYINYQDEAFPHYELKKIPKINFLEIKDVFYKILVNIFKNYEKFFLWEKDKIKHMEHLKEDGTEIIFLKEAFLKSNDALDNEFLILFQETSLFTQFINCFNPEQDEVQKSMVIFLESIKKGRKKNKFYFSDIQLEKIELAPEIKISDLEQKMFFYSGFNKLDENLFIHYKAPKIPYKSKFYYYKDEWCYDLKKMAIKDWVKYLFFIVHDIWFTFFSYSLNFYEDNQAVILMDYALSLIENIIIKKGIPPTRNIFSKIIKSLGRNVLTPFMKQLLIIVYQAYKNKGSKGIFQNDFLNGLYALSLKEGENRNHNIANPLIKKHIRSRSEIMLSPDLDNKSLKKNYREIESYLKKLIFLTSSLCPNCFINSQIVKKISPEEILAGICYNYEYNNLQTNNCDKNNSLCINCLARFQPKIYYFGKNDNNINPKEINILSPMNLIEEIDKIFKEKGEKFFYNINNIDNNIYLNIVFYFELFDLPLSILYVQNDMDKFEKIKNQLKQNLERKNILKKKNKKENFSMTFTPKDWNFEINQKLKDKNNINSNNNKIINNIKEIKGEFNNVIEEEKNIWKNIQIKILENKDIYSYNNKINIDDKNEIIKIIKEMKEFIKDSLTFFNEDSQAKLYKFLINYEIKKEKELINTIISEESTEKSETRIQKITNKNRNRLLSPEIKRKKSLYDYKED